MDYNKLRVFIAVVQEGGITPATRVLHRTQSALSQQLSALEGQLGRQLFDRVGHKLVLTPFGEELYALAREHLHDIDEGIEWLLHRGKQASGRVRVGLLQDHSTDYKFFPLLAQFRHEYPRIEIHVTFDTSAGIETALLENRLDVGFLINFQRRELFERHCVARETHLLVASPDYLEARAIRKPADLVETELIDLDTDFTCLSVWFRKHATRQLARLRQRQPAIVAPNHQAILEILVSGYGIGVSPAYLAAPYIENGTLCHPLDKERPIRVELDLAIRKSHRPALHEKLFLDYFVKNRDGSTA